MLDRLVSSTIQLLALLFCLQVEGGDTKELFAIGTNRTEPCLLPLMSGEILVLKEEMQISLDANAKPTQQQPLVWSDLPMAIEHVHPFIVGLLPK